MGNRNKHDRTVDKQNKEISKGLEAAATGFTQDEETARNIRKPKNIGRPTTRWCQN